jgi:hypothetical protein
MNGSLKYDLDQIENMANRLFNLLTKAGPVRVCLMELRDAANTFQLALDQNELSTEEFCKVANEVNQLQVFICNVGTGLEQQGAHSFHPKMNHLTLDHLGRWTAYFCRLAEALAAGTGNKWVNQNPPPPGQPDIPHG